MLDLKQLFFVNYHLEDAVVDRLEFFYVTKIGKNGNTKNVKFDDEEVFLSTKNIRYESDSNLPSRTVIISDINVCVWNQIGDEVEEDTNCDSSYMIPAMDHVGKAIRKAYHWVPIEQKCYLVMDNVGGHGTDVAIKEYRDNLEVKYNIEIIFQIPRSPYTNVLDLGV